MACSGSADGVAMGAADPGVLDRQATVREALVGQSVLRTEDLPLLTGHGCFVDDVDRPGQVWARIVRSQVAHGRIAGLETAAARRHPGVVAVVTAAHLPDVVIPIRLLPSPEAELVRQPPLARDVVRYVGEPVAVVVARSPYVAEDAAEEVVVELDELDPVLDARVAADADATRLHAGSASNVMNVIAARHGEPFEALMERAQVVVRDTLEVKRNTAVPMETRGLVAELDDASGRLTVWGPAKVKHFNREALAGMLGMAVEDIRFVEPDVGGGFGVRGEFYPEDFLIPWLACRLRRPVKWIEDRHEHFLATNHARDNLCAIEVAASGDGRLLGLRARVWVNQGAYVRTHGSILLPRLTARHLPGPYVWEGIDIESRSVLTNKTPSGTYRGPGQYEPAFFRERMLDRVAAQLALDPLELRERNVITTLDMPFTVMLGGTEDVVYDAGDFPRVLSTLADTTGYGELRHAVSARRRSGATVGIGVAAYVEEGGFGPWETAHVVPRSDGGFVVHVGIAAIGQGVRTALGQVAADALGVDAERVEISHQDTDRVTEGFGAYASRTTVLGGNAIVRAVADLERNARVAGALALDVDSGELEVDLAQGVRVPGRAWLALSELGCEGRGRYDKPYASWGMGAHLAVVSVDRETGAIRVERLVACHDVGRMVNPALVRGQFAGGAVQGAAGALFEALPYDEAGQPLATSFMDYGMPTAAEMPPIEAVPLELPHHDPATANPLGVKGAGESGIIGMGAAIANAVADATGGAVPSLPISLARDQRLAM
jgi:carbon-monoxide dehydrogenase large subunit